MLHRILKLAGLPTDQENDNIQFLVLREYTPDQRRDIIRWALHEEQNIGLVIIDGIRDLIHDINSPSESLDIINELMRWSSYYELHIHTVLHLNKGDDNTRGHIGTELNNKAETILQISKNNENGKISERPSPCVPIPCRRRACANRTARPGGTSATACAILPHRCHMCGGNLKNYGRFYREIEQGWRWHGSC